MAYLVSIGGMQMKGWSVFLPTIVRTYKALNAAKAARGCVHAEIFRDGRTYFALSVWEDREAMQAYAHAGTHAELMRVAPSTMAMFRNESFESDHVPGRDEAKAIWRARG